MNDKSPAADTTGLKQATQHRPSGGHVHHSTRRDLGVCRATRVRVILALGVSFSPVQVASLLARAFNVGAGQPDEIEMAYRAGYAEGYRALAAEQNAAWPPKPIFWATAHNRQVDQVAERRRADAEAVALAQVPVLAGYHGGPV